MIDEIHKILAEDFTMAAADATTGSSGETTAGAAPAEFTDGAFKGITRLVG